MKKSLEEDLERLKNGYDERAEGMAKLTGESETLKKEIAEIADMRDSEAVDLGELDSRLEASDREREGLLVSRAEAGKDIENAGRELSEAELRLAESRAGISETRKP